jgi:putative membrane protein
MGIFWIVVVGLIIWAVVAAGRGAGWSGGSDSGGHSESALEILKRRYARGEINKTEYEEKKKDLV